MIEEPGFTIEVVAAGQVVSIATSTDVARRNVEDAIGRPRSGLFGVDPATLDYREVLHAALSKLAANVLLEGDPQLRAMQDLDGRWWTFRSEQVGAIAVIDLAGDRPKQAVGFHVP